LTLHRVFVTLTPKTIKKICLILTLIAVFAIAIIFFSNKAYAYSPLLSYTSPFDFEPILETPQSGGLGFKTPTPNPDPPKRSKLTQMVSNGENPYVGYLRSIAGSWFDLEYRIIMAESGFQPEAKNKSSSASGLAQFINGTFQSQCINKYHFATSMVQKNDPYVQLNCLDAMIRDGGQSHWNASRVNWE